MEKLTKYETGSISLVNIVEEMVRQKVDEKIKDFDMCDCEKCRMNVCAIALNHIPPHYVTTEKGALLGKVDDSEMVNQAKLYVEVVKAFMVVKENPFH